MSAPSPCERPCRLRVLWADLTPSSASASLLAVEMAYLACRPGPTRVSQVPGASLSLYHTLGGPRRILADLTCRGPFAKASGALYPSPSAFSSMTGLSHASGSAVFPAVCGIPCVRFNRGLAHPGATGAWSRTTCARSMNPPNAFSDWSKDCKAMSSPGAGRQWSRRGEPCGAFRAPSRCPTRVDTPRQRIDALD